MSKFGILIFGLALVLSGCGKDGSAVQSSGAGIQDITDPLVGQYYTAGKLGNTNDFYYNGLIIEPGNKIKMAELLFPNGNQSLAYMRKAEGTYVNSGNTYNVVWSYEMCDPVGTNTLNINWTDPADRIFVANAGTTIQFLNAKKWTPESNYTTTAFTVIEDTECNKFPF